MVNKLATWGILAILGLVMVQSAAAQSGPDVQTLGKEVEALKAGQAAMQKDLQEIKNLLRGAQAAPAPAPAAGRAPSAEATDVMLSLAGAPVKRQSNAQGTLLA